MAKPTTTVHVDPVHLGEVLSGRLSANTPAGFVRHANGQFETLFVAFNRDGSPELSDNGRFKLNGRPQ